MLAWRQRFISRICESTPICRKSIEPEKLVEFVNALWMIYFDGAENFSYTIKLCVRSVCSLFHSKPLSFLTQHCTAVQAGMKMSYTQNQPQCLSIYAG